MFPCLLLTPWWTPHQVIDWQKSISMLYTGEIDVLESYDEEARSPSITIRFPAVARLNKKLTQNRKEPKFSRPNVYARDGHECQYCGARLPANKLNYDHVVPRSKGGKTTWNNIATACISCNLKKGAKSLKQSGMKLKKLPIQPKSLPMGAITISLPSMIPALWLPYLNDRIARAQTK